jgi:acyl carrier protein
MDHRTTALAVIARIAKVDVERLSPETELVADLELDSARALELLVEIEDVLGTELSEEAAERLNTVGDILAYIEEMQAGSRGPGAPG